MHRVRIRRAHGQRVERKSARGSRIRRDRADPLLSQGSFENGRGWLMGKMNTEWHTRNRMPERATREQRIAWHVVHANNCGCREIPASIRSDVVARMRAKPSRKAARR